MCGIVGLLSLVGGFNAPRQARGGFERLLTAAESRGREASGAVWLTEARVLMHKAAEPACVMMRRSGYRAAWNQLQAGTARLQAVFGHSRLTTHGTERVHQNNQPVQGAGFTLVHNGIITNWQQLWQCVGGTPRTELDTEVLPALLHHFGGEGTVPDVEGALERIAALIQGTVSIAFVHRAAQRAWLFTNHGSLYWTRVQAGQALAFASESRFLREALRGDAGAPVQVAAGEMLAIDFATGEVVQRRPQASQAPAVAAASPVREVVEVAPAAPQASARTAAPAVFVPQGWSRFEVRWDAIARLRRCTRGVLPETMPFIAFDAEGVSNYARHYQPYRPQGVAALTQRIETHLREHGKRCIVAFSGGRDSSFGLQYIKRAGMEPMAYTYDWGVVTDLARRNQARLCGRLGVEHIIVSADIRTKRDNIRKNVLAWLRRPHLGTVPLFMAGDKQYFHHANRLRQAYGMQWVVLAANPLERTHFKSGFAGVRPGFLDRPRPTDRLRLLGFYGGEFLRNPAFLNSSLLDTAGAFLSFYAIQHDHLRIFDYLRWDEEAIDAALQADFDWEHATDTATTWRIGDGTAAFYNYIFMQVAGFTENDSLRHNQVLEGTLPRERALELVRRDNQPRFESIEWYCRTIGLDPIQVLERICTIPRLYGDR